MKHLVLATLAVLVTSTAFAESGILCQGDGAKAARTCFMTVTANGILVTSNGSIKALPRVGTVAQAGDMIEDIYKDLDRLKSSYCETNPGDKYSIASTVTLQGEGNTELSIGNKTREGSCKK